MTEDLLEGELQADVQSGTPRYWGFLIENANASSSTYLALFDIVLFSSYIMLLMLLITVSTPSPPSLSNTYDATQDADTAESG